MIESAIEKSLKKYCQKLGLPYIKLDASLYKGIPDRMVILPGAVLFIELKTKEGRLSFHQIIWQERLERLGHRFHVVRSVKEGKELIDGLYSA